RASVTASCHPRPIWATVATCAACSTSPTISIPNSRDASTPWRIRSPKPTERRMAQRTDPPSPQQGTLLEVDRLQVHFPLGGGLLRRARHTVKAVDNVSFSI